MGERRPTLELALDDGSFTLVAAWRSGRRYLGRQISTAGDLEAALRSACVDTAELLDVWDYRQYRPDSLLEEHEFTVVPRKSVPVDSSVLALINDGAELDHMAPGELAHRQIAFYAAILGDDPEHRTAYIAKHNPARVGRQGRIVSLGRDVLSRVDDPLFIFEPDFDLVVDASSIAVFNSPTFELLFRDAPEVIAAVRGWVAEITVAMPFDANGADALIARCENDSRLRRRLFAIKERGHLRDHTVADVVSEARRLGRDPDLYVHNGALFFAKANPRSILALLNEDLWVGGFSAEGFQAQRKTAI